MIHYDEDGVIQPGSVFIRTPYNYDTDEASDKTGLKCEGPGKTQQQFKDETDINTIVERFGAAGELPPTMQFPQDAEFEEAFDFQTSMNVIRRAEESFMQLTGKQRARFNNSPQQFMEFMHDPENIHEMERLGLATIRKPVEEKPPETKETPTK